MEPDEELQKKRKQLLHDLLHQQETSSTTGSTTMSIGTAGQITIILYFGAQWNASCRKHAHPLINAITPDCPSHLRLFYVSCDVTEDNAQEFLVSCEGV